MRAAVASALRTVVRPTTLASSPEVSTSRAAGRPAPARQRSRSTPARRSVAVPAREPARGVRRGRLEQERTNAALGPTLGDKKSSGRCGLEQPGVHGRPSLDPTPVAGGYPHFPACGVRVLTVFPPPPLRSRSAVVRWPFG